MKKLMLTCAILCAVSLIASAQDKSAPTPAQSAPAGAQPAPPPPAMRPPGPNPEQMAQQRANGAKTDLNLNEDQYKKAYDAELEFSKVQLQARMRPAPGTPRPDRAAMQQAIQKANTDKDAKYKEFLTADQWTKYDAGRPKMPPPPAPAAPAPVPATK